MTARSWRVRAPGEAGEAYRTPPEGGEAGACLGFGAARGASALAEAPACAASRSKLAP